MLKKYNRLIIAMFLCIDLIIVVVSLRAAYFLRFETGLLLIRDIPPIEYYFNLHISIVAILIFLFTFWYHELYESKRGRAYIEEIFSVFTSVVVGTILLIVYWTFFVRNVENGITLTFSRKFFVLFWFLNVSLLTIFRYFLRSFLGYLRTKGFNKRHILVVGAGDLGRIFVEKIQRFPEAGLSIKGFVDDNPDKINTSVLGFPVLGNIDDIMAIMKTNLVDQIYIALPVTAYPRILSMLNNLQESSVELKMIPDVLQYITLKARMEDFDGVPVVTLNTTPMSGWQGGIKRVLDLIISIIGMILTSWLWGIIAMAIKLTSKGPIFYNQERMGLDGQSFQIYKFRSMYVNAEQDSGPVWATKNDKRRTGVGKVLRYLGWDELPQLINVLKGEMSLVGPRPERPEMVEIFRQKIPKYMLRHKVKAGLTGLAQINGYRGNTSLEKRVEFDI